MSSSKVERRVMTQPLELRTADGQPSKIVGYASVFNRDAEIAGMFRERIAPGAFTKAIKSDDVRALFNHDPNYVIGRTTSGTLTLSEDETGLHYEASPPDTQWARDLMVSVTRGDVSQSSFGFQVVREEWTKPENRAELPLRTVLEAKLFDVSPVTYPAYEETSAEARAKAISTGGLRDDEAAEEQAELIAYRAIAAFLTQVGTQLGDAQAAIAALMAAETETPTETDAEEAAEEEIEDAQLSVVSALAQQMCATLTAVMGLCDDAMSDEDDDEPMVMYSAHDAMLLRQKRQDIIEGTL